MGKPSKGHFGKRGRAPMTERIGMRNKMHNGMEATIVSYRTSTDMDVCFEDGYLAKHISYSMFCKGHVANKNIKPSQYHVSEYIGQKAMANCGLSMKIIAYRNAKDIDVRFEDGVIVRHTSHSAFIDGRIGHPNISKGSYSKKRQVYTHRVGEKNTNNNGEEMTILAYRNAKDIDVIFADGSIAKHRKYADFKAGATKNPNKSKNTHIGEQYLCNNGQVATITDYYSYKNVTITFEDGNIKDHVSISELKKGSVANSNMESKAERLKNERLGTKRKMRCGLIAEIVAYNGVRNITVKFSNGEERKTDWRTFESGAVKPKGSNDVRIKENRAKRIGCSSVATNGLKMTIVDYNGATDIKVMFENGEIVDHVTWDCFLRGSVSCPNIGTRHNVSLNEYCMLYYLKPYGFIHYSNKRENFEIDIYNPEKMIGIEYDGQHFHGKDRFSRDKNKNSICKEQGICLYRIREPGCPDIDGNVIKRRKTEVFCEEYSDVIKRLISTINNDHNLKIHADVDILRDKEIISQAYAKEFSILGEESVNNKNEKMVIVNYRNHKDIDVQFEDGTTVYHKAYSAFKKGQVKNPNYYKNTRLHLRKQMNNGLYAEIAEYRSSLDVDIVFEDGAMVRNRRYADFDLGCIEHPKITSQSIQGEKQKQKYAALRIGESNSNRHGDKMTVIGYRSAIDIDIVFEDGTKRENVTYQDFKNGILAKDKSA